MTDRSAIQRRDLVFDNWDQVLADLERLQQYGYDQTGNWSLSQNCRHLNDWLRFTMDGFPVPPWPLKIMLGAVRMLAGKRMLKRVLTTRKMPVGGPTTPQTVYPDEKDADEAAAQQLTATIKRFQAYRGPIQPSPLFGDLDYETATRLHLIHVAHHLSFLVPRS